MRIECIYIVGRHWYCISITFILAWVYYVFTPLLMPYHFAGRENITVLGVCSAAGITLDPLVIFQGKNMQSTWFGDETLPNTFNGVSKNGKSTKINELSTSILLLSFYGFFFCGFDNRWCVMWLQYIFLFHSRLDGHRSVLWIVWEICK